MRRVRSGRCSAPRPDADPPAYAVAGVISVRTLHEAVVGALTPCVNAFEKDLFVTSGAIAPTMLDLDPAGVHQRPEEDAQQAKRSGTGPALTAPTAGPPQAP